MAPPSPKTVLGDFENARFAYAGVTSILSTRDGKYLVRTDGANGKLVDLEVKYTFGVYPVQQYLVELPNGLGRLQALSIAWDARPKREGGQRWFHLYPGQRVTHTNALHWTRPSQNWNQQCADCHSTAVRKNYEADDDRFDTQWKEIGVGCEACHGPGSKHVAWAAGKSQTFRSAQRDSSKGLSVRLAHRRGSEREVMVCAQCHSVRRQIAEGYEAGKEYLDYYRPALLSSAEYSLDKTKRGEAYTWGSFVQSRMYAMGVTCSDCHDPHRGALRTPDKPDATCARCHAPSTYDAPAHRGRTQSAGASCVECHMPSSTSMVVGTRHDHSFRAPRSRLNATAPIVRATALGQMHGQQTPAAMNELARALRDSSAIVRIGALQSAALLPPEYRAAVAGPLLFDSLRAVRLEAAAIFIGDETPQTLTAGGRGALQAAEAEYIASLRYNANRADARTMLATSYAERGELPNAARELEAAIRLDSTFVPAYVKLADVRRAQGREDEVERVLRAGLAALPRSALLHHALGLSLMRQRRAASALEELGRAAALDPQDARFAYVYALALESVARTREARLVVERAMKANPDDADLKSTLARLRNAANLDKPAASR